VIALFLLATVQPPAADAPARLVRLDCELGVRAGSRRNDKWPASIRLAVAGRRIDSVLIDGPAPFSSYAQGGRELLPRRDRYRGSFQKDAIRLRRTGPDRVDLVLEPKDSAAGGYSGFWTHSFMVEQRPVAVEGVIGCRPAAGTLAGNN
jgi:hypothetical protein